MSTTLLIAPDHFPTETGAEIEVSGDDHHHLFRAKRLRRGDALQLVDGNGRVRRAEITSVERRRATLRSGEVLAARRATREVEVWVANQRPERASWAVEKLTELGVRRIVFYRAERSQQDYAEGQQQRLHRVAKAALQQSGGAFLPALDFESTFSELFGTGPVSDQRGEAVDASTEGSAPLATLVLDLPPAGHQHAAAESAGAPRRAGPTSGAVRLVIGPEGGFSEDERLALAEAVRASDAPSHAVSRGGSWHWLSLGELVLRVETAAVVGAALVLHAPRLSQLSFADPRGPTATS